MAPLFFFFFGYFESCGIKRAVLEPETKTLAGLVFGHQDTYACCLGCIWQVVFAVASPHWPQASGLRRVSVPSSVFEACKVGKGQDTLQGKEELPCAKAGWTSDLRYLTEL